MRKLAGSLTLAAGGLILLALPLVIGATQHVQTHRFTGLMLAALLACVCALVLTRLSNRIMQGAAQPQKSAAPAQMSDDLSDERRD